MSAPTPQQPKDTYPWIIDEDVVPYLFLMQFSWSLGKSSLKDWEDSVIYAYGDRLETRIRNILCNHFLLPEAQDGWSWGNQGTRFAVQNMTALVMSLIGGRHNERPHTTIRHPRDPFLV